MIVLPAVQGFAQWTPFPYRRGNHHCQTKASRATHPSHWVCTKHAASSRIQSAAAIAAAQQARDGAELCGGSEL